MRLRKALVWPLFCVFLLFACSCASEQPGTRTKQAPPPSKSQDGKSTETKNASPSQPQSDLLFAQIDNQMSVAELRGRLDEVKAIEREARRMAALRRNWVVGVSECMRMMERLKPRAAAIRDEYQRMLSPAGMEIAGAAINLIGCINCVEGDDDDCSDARNSINKGERELKKEMRRK